LHTAGSAAGTIRVAQSENEAAEVVNGCPRITRTISIPRALLSPPLHTIGLGEIGNPRVGA